MAPALVDLRGAFHALQIECVETPATKRGPKPRNKVAPMTNAECLRRSRAGKNEAKLRHIAVLDFETDPFDADTKAEILPFVCELYSDQFGSIVIWEDDFDRFITKVATAIEGLPDAYTIYAHNGGKFDFLFLVRHLRGAVKFKGRAIMCAKIGNHELRDSLHLLPEPLAAWKKDHFDYSKMKRCNRRKFRDEILTYLHSDCVYLFDIIKSFVAEFGRKISIGQAAFAELQKTVKVAKLSDKRPGESSFAAELRADTLDAFLRRYFFGGRVECVSGRGLFDSSTGRQGFKLYDVNSMYPDRMANLAHPIGKQYTWRRGGISENTIFIDVECRNFGAFVSREKDNPLDAAVGKSEGRFFTTKWEYDVAKKYGLIENDTIVGVVDCDRFSDFASFIVPNYEKRMDGKKEMARLKALGLEDSFDFEELHKWDLFRKYLLNNSYGKNAQNPRNFKEYYYTDAGQRPPADWMEFLDGADDDTSHKYSMPIERANDFSIWAKPSPGRRFNNVGTAASITGAARAKLLEALQHADDAIYCDTDSIICRNLGNVDVEVSRLGAWKLEAEFDRIIIAGRKLYACEVRGYPDGHEKRIKIRSKGAQGLVWSDFEKLLDNQIIETINKAPTISKTGEQQYMRRKIRATAPAGIARANRKKETEHGITRDVSIAGRRDA